VKVYRRNRDGKRETPLVHAAFAAYHAMIGKPIKQLRQIVKSNPVSAVVNRIRRGEADEVRKHPSLEWAFLGRRPFA
jgi:hypothetical protein